MVEGFLFRDEPKLFHSSRLFFRNELTPFHCAPTTPSMSEQVKIELGYSNYCTNTEGGVPQTDSKVDELSLEQSIVPAIENVKAEEILTEKQQRRKALLPFAIISISYLLYTMMDGSVRMIVLLHAYNKKFTAMEVLGLNY